MWPWVLSMVEIFCPVWMLQFQPMKGIDFITGHMIYNLAYSEILQTTETLAQFKKFVLTLGQKVYWNKIQTNLMSPLYGYLNIMKQENSILRYWIMKNNLHEKRMLLHKIFQPSVVWVRGHAPFPGSLFENNII